MGAGTTPTKNQPQRRRGAIISGAITVLVLAAVLIGVAALGPTQSEKQVKLGLTESGLDAQQYAVQAEGALASGDTTAAVALAKRALSVDPNNPVAKSVIVRASSSQSGSSSSSNGSSGGSGSGSGSGSGDKKSAADPDEGFTKRLSTMAKLLPAGFNDYFLGGSTTTQSESQVSATPVSARQEANQIIWTVHQTGSKAEARAFVSDVSKNLYANDSAALNFDGVTAYFGTDGARFATVAYIRGIYVFEVLVTGNTTSPKTLKALAQKAAEAFADKPPK